MLKLVQQEEPDVMVFTHPFPCGAASILKRQGHIDVPLVAIMTDFSSHQFGSIHRLMFTMLQQNLWYLKW